MRYAYLSQKIKENGYKKILEVGTYTGYHSLEMINASISAGNNKDDIHYYGFDLFESYTPDDSVGDIKVPPSLEEVKNKLEASGVNIHLYKGDTRETIPEFTKPLGDGLKMDFIYIDGGHSFENIETDWNNVQPLIDNDTMIIFDDYNEYTNATPVTWGCNPIINSLDEKVWNVEKLPSFDLMHDTGRKIYYILVTKKES